MCPSRLDRPDANTGVAFSLVTDAAFSPVSGPAFSPVPGAALSPMPGAEVYAAREHERLRAPENYSPDPRVWLAQHTMTQTEVSLRLAHYLLDQGFAISDVSVALTGYELTRNGRPIFPVVEFLRQRGHTRRGNQAGWDWEGAYQSGTAHALVLHKTSDAGDVVATLASGRRLVVHVSRGSLQSTRSPAEYKLLRGALGRALTFEQSEPGDLSAAAVPRSKRFRQLAVRWRAAENLVKSES